MLQIWYAIVYVVYQLLCKIDFNLYSYIQYYYNSQNSLRKKKQNKSKRFL